MSPDFWGELAQYAIGGGLGGGAAGIIVKIVIGGIMEQIKTVNFNLDKISGKLEEIREEAASDRTTIAVLAQRVTHLEGFQR